MGQLTKHYLSLNCDVLFLVCIFQLFSLSVYIIFCLLVGKTLHILHYIFYSSPSCLVPWPTSNYHSKYDYWSLHGCLAVSSGFGCKHQQGEGSRVHQEQIHWFGPWPEASFMIEVSEVVSLSGGPSKRGSICINVIPSIYNVLNKCMNEWGHQRCTMPNICNSLSLCISKQSLVLPSYFILKYQIGSYNRVYIIISTL